MKSTKVLGLLFLSGLIIVFLAFGALYGGTSGPADCQAPDEWFTTATKPPDASVAPKPDCRFHQWSWQMFLFLTLPDGAEDRLTFMNMPPPSTMFMPESKFAKLASNKRLKVSARQANTAINSFPFLSIEQADTEIGKGSGILVHRNGRAVYYSQHINQKFFDFVVSRKLNDFDTYTKVAVDPKLQFDQGVLELKASWRIVEDGENTDGFFVTEAEIDLVKNVVVNGQTKVVVDPQNTKPAKVALVGLHVVGVTQGHPGFIWGTFEHNGNAPDLDPKAQPGDPVSAKDFTFYTAKTKRMDCNVPNIPLVKLNEKTQKLTPVTNVARLNPNGGDTNQDIVKNLNDSVHKKLEFASIPESLKKNRAIWKNYDLVGTVWLPGTPVQPGKNFASVAVGSTKLANATMETFRQPVPKNCFGCHTTQKAQLLDDKGAVLATLPASNLNLSHALVNNLLAQKAQRSNNGK